MSTFVTDKKNAPVADRSTFDKNILSRNSNTGRYTWRKAHGLLTIGDISRRWRAVRYVQSGGRSPVPESLLRGGRP